MDFIINISTRSFLAELHKDYQHEASLGNASSDLKQIPFAVFVRTCLKRIRLNGFKASKLADRFTENDVKLILCGLYDRIDIDSMGYISWDDFTSHVLRAGKTHLKPMSMGNAALEYKKSSKSSKPLPARSMWYA